MTKNGKIDVIVVGAGASGAIVAAELAQSGARVACMDKGPHYSKHDFDLKFDEIRYYARGAIVPHMSTDPMTWRERSCDTAKLLPWVDGPLGTANPLYLPPSLGTGGGSIHWGGACWRFREAEFSMLSLISGRLGTKALPENHTLVDWPITYSQLEPYYDRVEWELGISGAVATSPTAAVVGTIFGKLPVLAIIRCRRFDRARPTNGFRTHARDWASIPSAPQQRLPQSHSRGGLVAPIVVSATAIPAM